MSVLGTVTYCGFSWDLGLSFLLTMTVLQKLMLEDLLYDPGVVPKPSPFVAVGVDEY